MKFDERDEGQRSRCRHDVAHHRAPGRLTFGDDVQERVDGARRAGRSQPQDRGGAHQVARVAEQPAQVLDGGRASDARQRDGGDGADLRACVPDAGAGARDPCRAVILPGIGRRPHPRFSRASPAHCTRGCAAPPSTVRALFAGSAALSRAVTLSAMTSMHAR